MNRIMILNLTCVSLLLVVSFYPLTVSAKTNADESLYVYNNRLYNNTFYSNGCYGIIGDTGIVGRYYDNQAVNNPLYKNTSCSGTNEQVRIPDSQTVILNNNTLTTSDPKFVNKEV